MRDFETGLTAQRVRELLSYDQAKDEWRWVVRPSPKSSARSGDLAGFVGAKDGCHYINIDGRLYMARRLAWLYLTGVWPTKSTKADDLSLDRLRFMLDCDPEAGVLTWRRSVQGVSVGTRAGSIERSNGHRYINLDGQSYLASRLVWFHVNGVWPQRLRFKDGNPENCAIANLSERAFDHATKDGRNAYNRAHRKANPDYYRGTDLKKDFGITLAEYKVMLDAQNGVCAICGNGETEMRAGRVKALAVDHVHDESQAIRALICAACNTGLGKFLDSPERLRAAAAYIERHAEHIAAERAAAEASNVVPIRSA